MSDREILDDRGRDRKRDIDPPGNQDDEQAGREHDVDGGVVQEVEQVDEGQERVAGQREKDADQGDDEDEPLLGRPDSLQPMHGSLPRSFPSAVRPGMYSAIDRAVAHVQDAVRIEVDFRGLVGNQEDRHALVCKLADDLEDPVARADINADGGGVQDEERRLGGQPLGKDDALLVAAREGRHRIVGMTYLHREAFDPMVDETLLLRGRQQSNVVRQVVQNRDGRVVGD